MANNVPKNLSDRGGYLIPPLPQTKLVPEKDKRARSPLGISGSAKNGHAFPFPSDQENLSSSTSLSRSIFRGHGRDQGKAQNMNRDVLTALPFTSSGNHREQRNIANVTVDKENGLPFLPSSSHRAVTTNKATTSRSVLRSRETMEAIFGLTSESSEEYRELSHKIADGRLSDNAAAWRRLLELARRQEESRFSSGNKQGEYLARLHQRATNRLPLTRKSSDSAIVLQVWLAYARVKEDANFKDDCRYAFLKIGRSGLAEKEASFYLAFADFEKRNNNLQGAHKIVKEGLEKNAQPIRLLEKALNEIGRDSALASATMRQNPRAHSRSKAMEPRKVDQVSQRVPPAVSPRKRRAESTVSPKRRRTERGTVEVLPTEGCAEKENSFAETNCHDTPLLTPQAETSSSAGTEIVHASGNKVPDLPSSQKTRDVAMHGCNDIALHRADANKTKADPAPPRPSNTPQQKEDPSNIANDAKKPGQSRQSATKSTPRFSALGREHGSSLKSKRPPLSKTSRLTKIGLSGAARRVGSGYSPAVDSDSDDSTTANGLNIAETLTTMSHKDLSYILDWKPGRSINESATGELSEDQKHSDRSSTAACPDNRCSTTEEKMISCEEETVERSAASAKRRSRATDSTQKKAGVNKAGKEPPMSRAADTRPSFASTQKTADTTNSLRSDNTESSSSTTSSSHSSRCRLSEPSTKISPSKARLVASSNQDFLPLVSESNIIRVNNVPYVKLGVVGRGGSSKVYRALTKDLHVVAIKKVKLSGMDQKAIDGYANEIDLLKRLCDNPAIIQMHHSEVDISRKAIYVVMEAGETDLNHALQQRTIKPSSSSGSRERKLDMNFIRLTWQQMLIAVHSIHEARIIHGDLKPANFLFVRGTLKLIDFGIAKAIQSEDTTNIYRDSHVGTLNYMSPEAILDSGAGKPGAPKMKCGRASDIWSLGCILYQMVYGRTPFAELHMIQKLQAIIDPNHEIRYPGTANSSAIDAIRQCLRRKPQDRPPIEGKNGLLNEHAFLNE